MAYDVTAWEVKTPGGVGKFISFKNGVVTVEMDRSYLVSYLGCECFIEGRALDWQIAHAAKSTLEY